MNKKVFLINVSIAVVVLIVSVIARFIINKDSTSISSTTQEQVKESKANSQQTATPQVEPKQEVAKAQEQTQVVEKPTETQTAEPQTATPPTQTQTQIQSESAANTPSVDYEQKFGKRIYLATKDEFVNMRNAPSGEIVAKIYKKDFENIMLYSFDTNSNEKWLKVVYFPPNVKDEQSAISGYIHISQIDKSRF